MMRRSLTAVLLVLAIGCMVRNEYASRPGPRGPILHFLTGYRNGLFGYGYYPPEPMPQYGTVVGPPQYIDGGGAQPTTVEK